MSLSKAEHDELCCVYAALLLHDDGQEISSDKLNKVITASGNNVEAYYPEFFANYFKTVDFGKLLQNIGTSAPSSTAAPTTAAPAEKEEKKDDKKGAAAKKDDKKAPAKKEEKKKEVVEDDEDEPLGLF